jgi:dephospho-CoA kinase
MPGLGEVIKRFGRGVIDQNGELDRHAMRDLIFSDQAARHDLEGILHPLIRAHMELSAGTAVGPYIVMAIPLLVEGHTRDRVNRVLLVDIDEALQLQRLVARDRCSLDQARAILASQASRSARLAVADDVVSNDGTVAELRQAVDDLHARYLRLAVQRPGA